MGIHNLEKMVNKMVNNGEINTWYETSLVEMIKKENFKLNYMDIQGNFWAEIDTIEDLKKIKLEI